MPDVKDGRPGSGPFAQVTLADLTHPAVRGGDGRKPLSGSSWAVWMVLAAYVGGRRNGWGVSIGQLVSDTGWPRRTVFRALEDLRGRGLLRAAVQQRPSGGQGTNRYWLCSPGHPVDKSAQGVSPMSPPRVSPMSPPRVTRVTPFGDSQVGDSNSTSPPSPPDGGDGWDKTSRVLWLQQHMTAIGDAAKAHPWDTDRYPYWLSIVKNSQHSAALWKAGAGGYWKACPPWGGVRTREVAAACQKALMEVAQLSLVPQADHGPAEDPQTG